MKTMWTVAVVALTWLTSLTTAEGGVGELDVRFAAGGRLNVNEAGVYSGFVLQMADGRFLVVGMPVAGVGADYSKLIVTRYLASGRPDSTFGVSGHVTVPMPITQSPVINAAALQVDGKILFAGAGGVGSEPWARYVVRLDASGHPDATFGTDGVVSGGFAGNGFDGWGPGYSRLLALPNGDVLAVIDDPETRFVDRYNNAGVLIARLALDRSTVAIATQGLGAAIIVGRDTHGFTLRRVTQNGFDGQFGDSGWTHVTHVSADALAVDPATGRIAVCGDGIGKWTADGKVDPAFGASGSGAVKFDGSALPTANRCDAAAFQADGRLVAVASDVHGHAAVSYRTFVVRVDSSGTNDGSVGGGHGWAELRGMLGPTVYWHPQSLQTAANGATLLTWNRSAQTGDRGTIVESLDFAPNAGGGAVGVPPSDLRLNERSGTYNLKVVRSGPPTGAASVRYAIAHGTTTAADVVAADGLLNWDDGDGATKTVALSLLDDAQLEGEETFQVRLFDATGVGVAEASAQITIVDDDALRALRFADKSITWTTGPGIPSSDWPTWKLHHDDALPGPVNAYFYLSNGIDSCCLAGVQWAAGETGVRKIAPFAGEALGSLYSISVVDDDWDDAGPSASVTVVVDPTPTGSGGGGNSGGSDGNGGGRGGGGALGGLDVALWLGAAGLLATARRRTKRTALAIPCGVRKSVR